MNIGAYNSYQSKSRASKGFEITRDTTAVVESNYNIPQAEAERIFGSNGTVPEGTFVRPYTVGTAIGAYTTVAGDLKIIEGQYETPYGVILQKVRYFDKNYRELDPFAVSYGERVSVATGLFDAVIQNFNANGQTSFAPPTKLFVQNSGQAFVDDGTLDPYSSGNPVGQIIEEGYIDYDARTGSPLVAVSGGVADELQIKCFLNYR